ncbi:MAG: alpha/beta hydrolase [Candidatus Binatia bacterium]
MTEHDVVVDGLRLHYLDWGNPGAPAVVLLHGGSAHAHWWDPVAPALAERFHVVAPDLRGHGDSAWAEPPAYEAEDYARDVVGLVAALGFVEVYLVGHSLGGIVAAFAAAGLGERLAALAIVDSRTKVVPGRVGTMQRLARFPHPRYETREEGVARYRLLPDSTVTRPELLAHVAGHALHRVEEGHWTFKFDRAALAAVRPRDVRPLLAGVRCPILAVRGGDSRMMPPKATAAMAAVAPQLETAEIAGAEHHVMLDRPAALAATLGAFLDRARATRTA